MLCRTLVRPPYDSKAGRAGQWATNVCLLSAAFCARMGAIKAAASAAVGERLRAQCLLGGILLGGMMAERATTEKQQRILEVIREFSAERGYPPSVREIGERVGLSSSSTVQSHLKTLERRGLLRRDPTKPRALVPSDMGTPRAAAFQAKTDGPA